MSAYVRGMSRAQRLLELIQLFRAHRAPVAGQHLADALGVSLRTLYRDIDTLKAQGAHIDGEPGLGYVLREGFLLPPLMFSEEEIEAVVLGSRFVAARTDAPLAAAARAALAKIAAVLPKDLREHCDATNLIIVPNRCEPAAGDAELSLIRAAIRRERKLAIVYRDEQGAETARTVWPFALGFFERVRMLVAWCELRGDFRHFRTDRIVTLRALETRYPRRRSALLREWQVKENMQEV